MKKVYFQIDTGVYVKGQVPFKAELSLNEKNEIIEPANLPNDFVSGSLSLPLETPDGMTEAPANSYALRKFNMDTITKIKSKYGLKGDIDVSVKISKDKKRFLTYTVYKTEKTK
jgi:hypothetical protein